MVSGRPLLYLSLPGIAFILGVFWFRRRNKNRLDNDDDANEGAGTCTNNNLKKEDSSSVLLLDDTEAAVTQNSHANGAIQNGKLPNGIAVSSTSMNINGNTSADEESPTTKLFGKSAPIKIQNNGRSSSGKQQQQQQQQQVDSEILKSKIQDAEQKLLRSIDEDFENLSSPVDLPDSINNRTSFYTRTISAKTNEPVVIKATRTPKISPENSFLESKYTKECEQNNNNKIACETIEERDTTAASTEVVTLAPTATSTLTQTPKSATPTSASALSALVATTGTSKNNKVSSSSNQNQNQKQPQKQQQSNTNLKLSNKVEETNLNDVANVNQKRTVDSASPSLSLCSEQSGDSGKGSSLPRSEATRGITKYEFFFPTNLIGQLYGRKRSFINQIKAKTSASVSLNKNRPIHKVRICTIEGAETEINGALAMIRSRLPARLYPNFTMQRIHYALPQTIVPLSSESEFSLRLKLIEGINNDVVVTTVMTGSHIFVHHPLHPSHPSLPLLQKGLYDSYTNSEAPLLPSMEISAVCVLPVNGVWYRVQIVDQDVEDKQHCIVKFLDFGGYMNVPFNDLRQIRSDFMGVPFQATECMLSNIEPIGSQWTQDDVEVLSNLTKGIVLTAQVAGYNSAHIPEVYLFATLGPNNVIFINKELVARNLARWVDI